MEILYAFFAEAVQMTSDGRMNILGADLQTLNVQGQPPWTVGTIYLVTSIRFAREECGHLYHFTATLVTPNGEPINPPAQTDFVVPLPENPDMIGRMSVVLQIPGLILPSPGPYHMHVTIEDRERNVSQEKQVRLRVQDGVPQNQPG